MAAVQNLYLQMYQHYDTLGEDLKKRKQNQIKESPAMW